MNEQLMAVLELVKNVPIYIWISAAGGLAVVIIILIVLVKRSRLLKSALTKMDLGEPDAAITAKLLSRPGLVEALIRRKGDEIISHFGIAEHLVRKLENQRKVDVAKRLLKLAPDEGLYPVFIAALRKESIAQVFRNWLKENQDILLIRKMALSARGRDFDGKKARKLLSVCFEEVRELSGDPEWPVRFFSLRVLLADDDPKSIRLVKECFEDPHPLLRRTVASETGDEDLDGLFGSLMTMVLDDPVPEVRQAARERIDSTFPDRWKLDPSGMNSLQSVHVLEQLKIGSNEDENVALTALKGEAVEARLAASRFLEKSGALERMFLEANRGDREDWTRRRELLGKAVSVGVAEFLNKLKTTDSVDVLLLASKLLSEGGDSGLILNLSEKAFSRQDPIREADEEELYRSAVSLACIRGDEKARSLICDELRKRRKDNDVLGFILPLLPPGEAPVFRDVLLEFLKDPDFAADESFLNIMAQLPSAMFLGAVLDILESDRSLYGHSVRLRALQCLGGWHLDHTLQTILENLPILPMEQARDFAAHLALMNRKALEERAAFILASPDAGIRAALISCLPAAGIGSFAKDIREGLNDADPEVRIACLRALLDAGELKATAPALALLRDPVERVRREAARIAGVKGTEKFLETLESILKDPEESPVVRIAAIEGLAASQTTESVAAMVRFLDSGEALKTELVSAMALKTDRNAIKALVEHFKDSEAVLRDRISDVFAAMGDKGEDALVDLLKEDIASLKPFLADILTRTGFVEILIRKLGHRKPQVRREAAELLVEIATDSAYRGIILAARDPDEEVRIKVTRALESLATPEGENILKSLEQDPDRKVRRYTHWAMERLKAKKLP
jgi:HEAT repeat protein